MSFEMNNIKYNIYKKSKEEMFGVVKEKNDENGRQILGLHLPAKGEIWLLNELPKEIEEKTLIHELSHCYFYCYMFDTSEIKLREEDVCEIISNSHQIIEDIVEHYFNGLSF